MHDCKSNQFLNNPILSTTLQLMLIALVCLMPINGKLYADDHAKGKSIFVKCQACHSLDPGVNKVGPSLHGVFGRQAGTMEDFANYSPSMKSADITWDEKTIRAFLKAPREYIPSTRMFFAGLQNDQEVSHLLTYLKAATAEKAAIAK